MQLFTKQIKKKEIVGDLNGKPVYLIETKGGLHLVAALKNGMLTTLGAGPHRAVCCWLAEKREPDIKWSEHLVKSDADKDIVCPTCHQEDKPGSCICLYRWGYVDSDAQTI